jgi:hypothetical protein
MTAIKTEDVIGTLHVICADPKLLEHHLKAVEAGGALKLMLLNSSALITSSKGVNSDFLIVHCMVDVHFFGERMV